MITYGELAVLAAKRIYEIADHENVRYKTDAEARLLFGTAEWREMKKGYSAMYTVIGPLKPAEIMEALQKGYKIAGVME